MEISNLIIIFTAVLFGALLAGVWVAASLFLVAFVALVLNENDSIGILFATTTWGGPGFPRTCFMASHPG